MRQTDPDNTLREAWILFMIFGMVMINFPFIHIFAGDMSPPRDPQSGGVFHVWLAGLYRGHLAVRPAPGKVSRRRQQLNNNKTR